MNCREAVQHHPRTVSFTPKEVIAQFGCPKCGARPGQECIRPKPRSHAERMWFAQGHIAACLPYLLKQAKIAPLAKR